MNIIKLIALALTALTLVPSGAHFFELPHKMALGEENYFVVQGIYAGWSLFALPILAAIMANGGLAFGLWRAGSPGARSAIISALLIVASLIVFFTFVFPGNQATANWTEVPGNWETLRRNWEYGHAANFILVFLALIFTGHALMVSSTHRRGGERI